VKLEEEIADLTQQRQSYPVQQPIDMNKMKAYIKFFLENLEKLLLYHSNPVQQARYFGVIFNEAPTYDDIVSGTADLSKITGVNSIFTSKNRKHGHLAGEMSVNLNRLLDDFITLSKKLEKLGFVYSKGFVSAIDPEGSENA
jgi:hypothetical protein